MRHDGFLIQRETGELNHKGTKAQRTQKDYVGESFLIPLCLCGSAIPLTA